ncbi:sugar porter family MFS transporter [Agromyces sp. MMS24-JH15]|uniref:sugar porter family MFS transporter n=1 Tax=Agromyces sp. MMS24-JH15 TaxID=3243765 RepID=UPI003748E585
MQAKAIGLAIAAAVGGFLFGFDSSVINGAVDAISEDFGLNDVITGFVVAIALIGCAIGAWLAGGLADRWGRLRVMLIGGIMFLISSIGSGFAFAAWDLAFWRVVGGLGIGIASVVAPAYISEIAPKRIRGSLASLQQLAITLGIFAALLSDALFAWGANGANEPFWFGLDAWRWMFLACVVPAAVYCVLSFLVPESPRYLMLAGREDEARAVFAQLVPESELDRSITDIRSQIQADREHAHATIRGPRFGLQGIVWIGIILSVFQQFVGINVIFYYSTTLWQAVGFDESDSFGISVATSVTNVLVTIVAIVLVDRIGRRPILITGSAGMTLALGAMAIAFAFASTDSSGAVTLPDPWGVIALVAANLFVVSFGASWGPVVWVLLGEIFPSRIRAKALGVAASAQWIANFLITVSFPPMSAWSLPITYGMYALFALLSGIFVIAKIPETRGMALEEAEVTFARKGSAAKTRT